MYIYTYVVLIRRIYIHTYTLDDGRLFIVEIGDWTYIYKYFICSAAARIIPTEPHYELNILAAKRSIHSPSPNSCLSGVIACTIFPYYDEGHKSLVSGSNYFSSFDLNS